MKILSTKIFIIGLITLSFATFVVLFGRPAGSKVYFVLARYNPDGTIDRKFGRDKVEDGIIATLINDFNQIYTLALQSDGKVLAGGVSDGKYATVRYTQDGAIDELFAKKGKFISDFDADYGVIRSIKVGREDEIFALGSCVLREKKATKYTGVLIVKLEKEGLVNSQFGENLVGGYSDTTTGRY